MVTELETLQKKRKAHRGWVTRARKTLGTLVTQRPPDKIALLDATAEFDKYLASLDEVQAEIELESAEQEIEADVEQAADFREQAREVRIEASRVLVRLDKVEREAHGNEVGSNGSARPEVRLPKLVLPTFSGNVLEWPSFWDQFIAAVDSTDLPDVTKFTYLRSLLEGEAKESIMGLSLTSVHYNNACQILKDRFGRKERIIFSHVQELLSLSSASHDSLSSLRKLQDSLLTHTRSLEALDIDGAQYGVLLTPIVLTALPAELRMEWARSSEGKESDLHFLLEFLEHELKLRETTQQFKNGSHVKHDEKKSRSTEPHKTSSTGSPGKSTTSLTSSTGTPGKKKFFDSRKYNRTTPSKQFSSKNLCLVCDKQHSTQNCFLLTKVSRDERFSRLRDSRICFRCLTKHENFGSCPKRCEQCGGNHHPILCDKGSVPAQPAEKPAVKSHTGMCSLATKQDSSNVVMQVLKLEVRGRNGIVEANVLFDSGADRTYVSSDLVNQIDPEFQRSERVAFCSFGNGKASKEELRNIYSLELRGSKTGCGVIAATEVPVVCAPLFRRSIPSEVLSQFGTVKLVEDYRQSQVLKIDILIGMDNYWKFVRHDVVQLPENSGLVAQKTVFGWILSGSYGEGEADYAVSHQLFCVQQLSDSDLQQLWDIDLESDHKPDGAVLEKFNESIEFHEGRYSVSLPWKSEEQSRLLKSNFDTAMKRLKSLSRKLSSQPALHEQYDAALREMEDSGVVEEVSSKEIDSQNPVFYMPHRPVIKEASASTKVRPVFDASAKGPNGLSLNDCMETGPNLLPNLVEILVRYRKWPVALVADIQKAFLQISVRPEDRDVHRFLWDLDGVVRVMRLVRVPFGNRSSPFILNATIKFHLGKFPATTVVDELSDNLYVDDWLSGADGEDDAACMVEEANDIMSKCSMNLTKWGSNKKVVLDQALFNLSDKSAHMSNLKVLGLRWSPEEDCFMFDGLILEQGLVITKRVVLSLIARLYDPLGFLTPFVIKLKCLFQDLWRLGVEWDSEVPEELGSLASSWIDDLSLLRGWRIPRPYSLGPWSKIVNLQLHAFGDASERAYGACVYLVADLGDGTSTSSLVLSKTKVAPVKRVTLPRLELLGAVLAAQLLDFVCRTLKVDKNCSRCWSDSTVVVSWIQGDSYRWKTFVANRIGQIHQLTSPSQWSHCAGTNNPADLLTRGVSASQLIDSALWLQGPGFLTQEESLMESAEILDEVAFDLCSEEAKTSVVNTASTDNQVFDVSRWGTFVKALRVVAWVLRVTHTCQDEGELTLEELEKAKLVLLRDAQVQSYPQEVEGLQTGVSVSKKSKIYKLSPFLDEDGLLRVKGRLDFSELSYDSKHPVILPAGHLATLIVRHQHHILKHAGVGAMLSSLRDQYWIIGARRLAKKVKRYCVACQKVDAKPLEQPMAPLHESRVRAARPFAVTGMDHAGPLYAADFPGKKLYILLFTCAVTRGIHLELVNSLNVVDCLLALRRFIARRGLPAIIWSDNAKTFVAAKQQLLKTLCVQSPQWNYIVPRSPWWGGWWERLVRSVKSALKKSVGQRCLVKAELETVLHEVEACVNSRPLTFVSDEASEDSPLTPSHFLVGKSNVYAPDEHCDVHKVTPEDLVQRKMVKDTLMDRFWGLWSSDYIRSLPVWKGSVKESPLLQNSLVLIREDGWPRMKWPLGVVVETYTGKDGITRSCKVKTRRGEFVRSVQRLHLLEVDTVPPFDIVDSVPTEEQTPEITVQDPEPVVVPDVTPKEPIVKTSKYGRRLKTVDRLDL